MKNKILVVAPHPDDETLGCGGTLLKHKKNGDEIYWMIVTNIDAKQGWNEDKVLKRQKEIDKASKMYGFTRTFKLDFPTMRMDTAPYAELIEKISSVIKTVKPSTVYLPNRSDVHTDHQIIFKAALSCTKNFRNSFINRILMYETLSETEFAPALAETTFIPNVYVDVTKQFKRKLEILKVFASEVMDSPWPRSIEAVSALARFRGSRIGKEFAESFCLLFENSG